MDIAPAPLLKTPPRQDFQRLPNASDAAYNDDFDAELAAATEKASEPARPEAHDAKPVKPSNQQAKDEGASEASSKNSEALPDSAVVVTAAAVVPVLAAGSPIDAEIQAQVSLPPQQQLASSVATAPVGPLASAVHAEAKQTPAASAQSDMAASQTAPILTQGVATSAEVASQGDKPIETYAQNQTTAQSQTQLMLPPGVDIAAPKSTSQASKKTATGAIDAAQTLSAAPAAAETAQGPKSATTPQPQGQGNAAKDGSEHQPANGASAANAHTQVSAPQAQDFKPDASAASGVQQSASPTVQNAPPAAPALVAQNAPVFVPPEALGVVIARKAMEGVNKFELRLDPPELGRLDVTLEVDEAGNTRAHIRAERPEALELLQREAKGMEQALRQAGLNLDSSSLSFSLTGREGREAHNNGQSGKRAKFNAVLPEDEIHAAAIRGSNIPASGIDLRV